MRPAFAVPTAVIRTLYAAPVSEWAWWTANLEKNLPFYSWTSAIATAVRNDVKVLLFLQLRWSPCHAWWRTTDGCTRSLGVVLFLYLLPDGRRSCFGSSDTFLPVLIFVLPASVATLEEITSRMRTPSSRREPATASGAPPRWRDPSSPDRPAGRSSPSSGS